MTLHASREFERKFIAHWRDPGKGGEGANKSTSARAKQRQWVWDFLWLRSGSGEGLLLLGDLTFLLVPKELMS